MNGDNWKSVREIVRLLLLVVGSYNFGYWAGWMDVRAQLLQFLQGNAGTIVGTIVLTLAITQILKQNGQHNEENNKAKGRQQ